MPLVTIITPTYNRAEKLPILYESLINQTNKDFEWLIVDDGSEDTTDKCVKIFQKESAFSIKYIKKENGGKHTALNTGIRTITTTLTVIVDSDDLLLPDAVELIHRYYNKYINNREVGALTFLRSGKFGKPIVKLPKDEYVDSYIKCRIRENRPGDMAEVFYTEVLKKYPFPEFLGERFLSEDVVWIELGKKFQHVFINKAIYQCEYLEGGLTDNDKPLKFASPLGSMMRGKMLMTRECGWKANIKGAIIYNCYKHEVKGKVPDSVAVNSLSDRIVIFMTQPLGRVFYKHWKKQV